MKRLKMPTTQQGFLALSAVIIIVFFAIITGTLAKLSATKSTASSYMVSSPRADGAAQAGLEFAINGLNKPQVGNRINCASMAEQTLANTKITFSNALPTDPAPLITLSGAINDSVTTITVANASGSDIDLTSQGRIYIDREAIDYLAIDGNTLSGITRGAADTSASSHANDAVVSQYQCTVNVTAESPSASPTAISEFQLFNQQEIAIAVGDSGHTTEWNRSANELGWLPLTIGSTNINAIDMLNPHQGFAVGNATGGNFSINRLDQGSWANTPSLTVTGVNSQNLHGISHLSSSEAFAVGDYDSPNNQAVILKWNGSNWLNNSFSTADETDLYDINMIDSSGNGLANYGLAVGTRLETTSGSLPAGCQASYDGCVTGNWWTNSVRTNCSLFTQSNPLCYTETSTACTNDYNNCIGGFILFRGFRCRNYIASCTDGPICYGGATGTCQDSGGGSSTNKGFALQYNGTTWSDAASSDLNSIEQLNSVSVFNSTNAYAAAQTSSGGSILYWNGTNWSIAQSTTEQMNAISIINTSSGFYGFAVGNNGEAYKLESGSWATVAVPNSPSNLTGVKVISPINAWLVTSNGKRYHWDGTEWLLNSSSPATSLNGVAAVGHRQLAKPYVGRHQVLN